ncbi:hypothetical protein [Neorhizobium sp. P12A]|uniref:hypothetical protein n=1 Tax=Neorhizobium sp. P12A TaxID=2268027 RepID=UPI0011EE2723|nr:hypothetical protein [Neorhizobium sp. P12A]
MTCRMMPPGSGLKNTIMVNGRTYTCALGSMIDVPDADAYVMTANGWVDTTRLSGPTANRPATPNVNAKFHDTTLNVLIVWDGVNWRSIATGGVV